MKIGTKIFLSTGCLVLIIMLAQGIISQIVVSGELRVNVEKELADNAENQTRLIQKLLRMSEEDMPVLRAHKAIDDYFNSRFFEDTGGMAESIGNLEPFLKRFAAAKPQYAILQIATAKGEPVLQITDGQRVESFTKFEYDTALAALKEKIAAAKGEEEKIHANLLQRTIDTPEQGWVLLCTSALLVDGKIEGLFWLTQPIQKEIQSNLDTAGKGLFGVIADEQGKVIVHTQPLTADVVQGLADNSLKDWLVSSHELPEVAWTMVLGKKKSEAYAVLDKLLIAAVLAFLASNCIGVAVLWFLVRGITRPVNRAIEGLSTVSERVTQFSDQISATSQELAEGSSQQAASLEETSSSLEEMAAMTVNNSGNSTQVNNLMTEVREVVEKASGFMAEQNTAMKEISKASEETSKIVRTIDEIAFQTNLLALNAAVEAARAGEAGAGFAVVADEVRSLARRAAEAARDTSALIEGTVVKVKEGTEQSARTTEAFSQVSDRTARVGTLINEIAVASNEQTQGIEQINKAVAEIDQVTQRSAASSEETAGAAQELNTQARDLSHHVEALFMMVNGEKKKGQKQAASASKRRIAPPALLSLPGLLRRGQPRR